jgi:hypothetical protein
MTDPYFLEERIRQIVGAGEEESTEAAVRRAVGDLESWRGQLTRVVVVTGDNPVDVKKLAETVRDRSVLLWPEIEEGLPVHPTRVAWRLREFLSGGRQAVVASMNDATIQTVLELVEDDVIRATDVTVWLTWRQTVTRHGFDAGVLDHFPENFFDIEALDT